MHYSAAAASACTVTTITLGSTWTAAAGLTAGAAAAGTGGCITCHSVPGTVQTAFKQQKQQMQGRWQLLWQ
jgi:hypothetical protein